MSAIVLTTLNARYIHASFGLRYLKANLGDLKDQTTIMEFGIKERPMDVVEQILALNPKIVGLGVYIWNVQQSLSILRLLKRLAPETKVIIGGPEVSYEYDTQAIVAEADVLITGEADLYFPEICANLLAGKTVAHIHQAPLPQVNDIALPYELYSDHDLAHRVLYVEASRGCPYRCEFCLSSLDIPVRRPQEEVFFNAMSRLLERGARHFKFVDRTFNLNLKLTQAILDFFLDRYEEGLFLHFEMVPDRLPEALRSRLVRFPAGSLQFEVGIQTFNRDVAERIQLRRDFAKAADNFQFLRQNTGVHIHADLIVGLPGEDLRSFAKGFNRLFAMEPQEIQVGILKRLKGTPIARHDQDFNMIYSPEAPYEILQNSHLTHQDLQRMRRFSQLWDRVGNSGRFQETLQLLYARSQPFESFLEYSDWVHQTQGQTHTIALERHARLLMDYLQAEQGYDAHEIGKALARDLAPLGRQVPPWLKPFVQNSAGQQAIADTPNTGRQRRHQIAQTP